MRRSFRSACAILLAASLTAVAPAARVQEPVPAFTAAETRHILRFGPWPPAPVRDPSNRLSGNAAAVQFGEALFFERRLSPDSAFSCASCHLPQQGWTDHRPLAMGRALHDRNTPSLWNVGQQRWFGWDGAHDSLWSQSIRPLLDPTEHGADAAHVAGAIRKDADLACRYRRATGTDAGTQDDEAVMVGAGKALAAFQETLVSGRTPFDDFRDALERGDVSAAARYPADAQRGLAIFIGKGNCSACHFGPAFSNGEFADVGVRFFLARGGVDHARYGGIRKLQGSRFNLLGPFNDDSERRSATGTRHVELRHSNWGEFKVPGLRNVADTAPYMHNGSLATLEDAVRHYSQLDEDRLHADGERILRRLDLTARESADLLAFLRSLSDGRVWQRSAASQEVCR